MKINSSLITLLTTAIVGMTFTACSNGDDITAPSPEKKVINYAPAKASKMQFASGGNVLCTSAITSRTCDSNTNLYTDMPDYPTDEEKAEVMAYIAAMPNGVQWPGYKRYYIQQIGGAHHTYNYKDNNGAPHSEDGTQAMEQLTIIEADGTAVHVNDFNGGNYNNAASHDCMLMTNGFQSAYAINEAMASTITMWKLFYFKGNYYLGLDYHGSKDAGAIEPDGCYDDWVLKIIESNTPDDDPGDDPKEELTAHVEVNLALNEPKETDDYIESKLSIHVRDTTDVEIFMPVPADKYCEIDDMYIVKNHIEGNYIYAETTESVSMIIAGQTVTLTCNYPTDGSGIIIKTEGINAAVLKALRSQYQDGLTFEIWNYYNNSEATRSEIQSYLNQSWCKCNTGTYINTVKNDGTYTLDCTVPKKED